MNKECYEKIKKTVAEGTFVVCQECGHVSNIAIWKGESGKDYGIIEFDKESKTFDIEKIKSKNGEETDLEYGDSYCIKCGKSSLYVADKKHIEEFLYSIMPIEDSKLVKILRSRDFLVDELISEIEVTGRTNNGVEMLHYLPKDNNLAMVEFESIFQNFDIDEEVEIHMQDKSFRRNFSYKEAYEDFEEYEKTLGEILFLSKNNFLEDFEINSEVYNSEDHDGKETACIRIKCKEDGIDKELKMEMFQDMDLDISVVSEHPYIPEKSIRLSMGERLKEFEKLLQKDLKKSKTKEGNRENFLFINYYEKDFLIKRNSDEFECFVVNRAGYLEVEYKIFYEKSELESFLDSIIDCEDFNAEGSLSLNLKILK